MAKVREVMSMPQNVVAEVFSFLPRDTLADSSKAWVPRIRVSKRMITPRTNGILLIFPV